MHIAALQMVSTPDVATNLRTAQTLLRQAADGGAELAVLPEYFCILGHRDTDKLAHAEPFGDRRGGPIQRFLAEAARDLGLWIVGGTLPLAIADGSGPTVDAPPGSTGAPIAEGQTRVTNTTLVFGPDGQCAARYDKIHLFCFDDGRGTAFDEARTLRAGAVPDASAPAMFELPSRDGHTWRVGLSICYDLRFPELYRRHAAAGCDLLLVPSAFTFVTGQAHWEILLRARAIENLAYVCAAAQGGLHDNGRRTWGHSVVLGPWGETLAQRDEDGPGVVGATLDASHVAAVRARLPALSHRRM